MAQRNMRGNGFAERFEIRQSGVAEESGTANFAYYADAPGESTRWYRENEWQQEKMKQPSRKESWVQVPLVTLAESVPERISWLKKKRKISTLNHKI